MGKMKDLLEQALTVLQTCQNGTADPSDLNNTIYAISYALHAKSNKHDGLKIDRRQRTLFTRHGEPTLDGQRGQRRWMKRPINHSNRNSSQIALTDDQVKEIRDLHAAGHQQVDIAPRFNVSQSVISFCVNRKTYKWVE